MKFTPNAMCIIMVLICMLVTLYVCILNVSGVVILHKDIKARTELLLKLIDSNRTDLVIG